LNASAKQTIRRAVTIREEAAEKVVSENMGVNPMKV
jgi:hypothetical protein